MAQNKLGSCCCSCFVLIGAIVLITLYSISKVANHKLEPPKLDSEQVLLQLQQSAEVTDSQGFDVTESTLSEAVQQYIMSSSFFDSSSTRVEIQEGVATIHSSLKNFFSLPVSMTITPTSSDQQIEVDKIFINSFQIPEQVVGLVLDTMLKNFTENIANTASQVLTEIKLQFNQGEIRITPKP